MEESELPLMEPELVLQCQAEFDALFHAGSQKDLDAARFRMVWCQVHSTDRKQVERGECIARLKLEEIKDVRHKDHKEFTYLLAVACFRLGKNVEARRLLRGVLEAHPDFHQATTLVARVEQQILRDGVWGVGVGAAVVTLGVALLMGARRR